NWGNSFPLLKSRIIAIQAADSNHLWVATPTSGLLWVQIHDGTVQKVDIVNERIKKPIENIQSMYREDNGRLWLATNHGVYRLSPDWSVLHLDHTNGLAADDVNAVVVKGDTLWAGTVAGLSRLVLSTLGGDGEFATMISSLRFTLDNQVFTYHLLDSATTRRFTTLTADARIIELDLSALDFTCRGKINFEYIIRQELLPWYFMTPNNLFQWLLNGFSFPSDTTFLEKGTLNLGVQLEPGRYQISITGISGTGARSKYPTEWTIQMAPYWYETVWVVFSALGFILFSAIRFRKNRSFVRKVDNKILHFKLIALQSQVNPHFIGNSVNSIQKFFYPFNFDKASRYITTFTRMLRQSMDFSETSFIPFREEVEYIENYLIMAQLRIGNHFTYEIKGVDKIPGSLMMPVMILQPFVENATIHGVKDEEKSHIIVAFEMQADTFHCAIIDDGPGVRSRANEKKRVRSKRKSKGLEIVSQKVEVLNQLYHLNMVCRVKDRSDGNPLDHGTRVDIYFRHPQTPQKPVAPSI
ncbi:MAG TPA: histidine kinase, partial [Anaerolineales bacterium]|nr:histidine kinase [Anaerolineales bacterium]